MVDLGKISNISEIIIYNRTDAGMEILSNYTVSILDEQEGMVWESLQEQHPNPSVTIPVGGKVGRFVKIQLQGKGKLALAAVIVN